MKDIQQLIKKDNSQGKYGNIYPLTYTDAIIDKSSGKTLHEILLSYNMYFLSYTGNTQTTRLKVPSLCRKTGLWITYVKYDKNVYTEWYAGDKIDDTSWQDSSNWRVGNNQLVGDISISSNGNWVINGEETEFKAIGEKGNTPILKIEDNKLQVSYNGGTSYIKVSDNPVYTIFRWKGTIGDSQSNNVGNIQASTDQGKTWTDMSEPFMNNLHISKYIGVDESFPTSGINLGTIYAQGPTYAEDDAEQTNPIYRLWVYAYKNNTLGWQDNGQFTSIAAGISQDLGDSETITVSQNLVTKFIDSYKVLLFLSPNILYGKIYNRDGNFTNNNEFDCTRLIELPYNINQIQINSKFYAITCFNSDYSFLGIVYSKETLLENTRFISVSFLKSDYINYKEVTISIIPPYAAKEIKRNNTLHFGLGKISPVSNILINSLENKSIEIAIKDDLDIFTNEGHKIQLNVDQPQSYILDNYYSLFLNIETLELIVDAASNSKNNQYIILAYNENGSIISGLLSSYYNNSIIQNNFKYEQLNSGFILNSHLISIESNEDESINVTIPNNIKIFKNQGDSINIPSSGDALNIQSQYSLFYDIKSNSYVIDSSVNNHQDHILLGFNNKGTFTYGLLSNIQAQNNTTYIKQEVNAISQSLNIPIGNLIIKNKGYNTTSGNLETFAMLDCTPLISVPANSNIVNISQGPLYALYCFDENYKFIGYNYNQFILENTRYVGISFLKSDNIDYSNLSLTFSYDFDYKISSSIGVKPGIMYKRAYQSSNGILKAFDTLDCTPLMQVPNSLTDITKIKINKEFYEIACFDKDQSFLGAIDTTLLKPNTKYFSVSFLVSENIDYNTLLISLLSSNLYQNAIIIPTSKEGKKYYLFGDSITYWDSTTSWYDESIYMVAYPSYIRDLLNADITNKGVEGNTANQITTRLLDTDLSDAYAVTYMAGSNDIQQGVEIGELGTLDRNTYIGNLEVGLQYVLSNYPNVKFYFISPPYFKNHNITPYCEAMQRVAEQYSIPIIRWDLIGGINKINVDYYTVEGLHPNNLGHKLFADRLIPFLQMY